MLYGAFISLGGILETTLILTACRKKVRDIFRFASGCALQRGNRDSIGRMIQCVLADCEGLISAEWW